MSDGMRWPPGPNTQGIAIAVGALLASIALGALISYVMTIVLDWAILWITGHD